MAQPNFADKTIWTGDNLDILRGMNAGDNENNLVIVFTMLTKIIAIYNDDSSATGKSKRKGVPL